MKIELKCIDCGYEYTLYDCEYFVHGYDIYCPKCGSWNIKEIKRR